MLVLGVCHIGSFAHYMNITQVIPEALYLDIGRRSEKSQKGETRPALDTEKLTQKWCNDLMIMWTYRRHGYTSEI